MTVSELQDYVMFQTANDVEDVDEFLPYLLNYLNEGYDRLVYAWAGVHTDTEEWPRLAEENDEPNLPLWTHRAIADWATWLVYRNGNPNKQSRGIPFRDAFEEILSRITSEGGKNGKISKFFNIPR